MRAALTVVGHQPFHYGVDLGCEVEDPVVSRNSIPLCRSEQSTISSWSVEQAVLLEPVEDRFACGEASSTGELERWRASGDSSPNAIMASRSVIAGATLTPDGCPGSRGRRQWTIQSGRASASRSAFDTIAAIMPLNESPHGVGRNARQA